ncbi:MAG: 4'-phosphopantetheinyl transferase superfamily protein [Thermodesulfobacteriota bacterium]
MGNDVVDLKQRENMGKSGDARFIGRVFTARERDRISGAAKPDSLLWALWAAKEAAFKVVSRGDPAVRSTPRRYEILLDGGGGGAAGVLKTPGLTLPAGPHPSGAAGSPEEPERITGRAFTPQGELALRIDMAEDYVHALSAPTAADLGRIHQRVELIDDAADPGDASAFVRLKLLEEIARCLDCPPEELSVGKEPAGPGAPLVFHRGLPLAVSVSLSHDGRFAAFAFAVDRPHPQTLS